MAEAFFEGGLHSMADSASARASAKPVFPVLQNLSIPDNTDRIQLMVRENGLFKLHLPSVDFFSGPDPDDWLL